jgi:hypothetical protein
MPMLFKLAMAVPSPYDRFSCMRVSGSDGVRVKLKRIKGLMGQHAACSPQMVDKCFATPQAIVLTQSRYPDWW